MTETPVTRALRESDPVWHAMELAELRLSIAGLSDALRESITASLILVAMADSEAVHDPTFRSDMCQLASDAITRAIASLPAVGSPDSDVDGAT